MRFGIFALTLLCVIAAPAQAQNWFTHPFGELRAYHGDWLAVCDEFGSGPCRMIGYEQSRRAESQVRLYRSSDSMDWTLVYFDRGLPERTLETISFGIDRTWINIPAGTWTPGDRDITNLLETVTIADPALTRTLLGHIRAGRWLTVRYTTTSGDTIERRYSLRGTTAASDAIEIELASHRP